VRNPAAEIVAIAEPDEDRRRAAARAFGVERAFMDEEELLDAVEADAVVVATTHAHHFDCARLALERGAHVLVEKPMVLSVGHARELVELARGRGVELVVGYPYHFNEQALALRAQIGAGRLGALEHVTCLFASTARELYRGHPERYADWLDYGIAAPRASTYSEPEIAGGGQAQTQLTHSAALLLWLTGLEAESVAAFTERFELAVDLADAAAVRFRGGAVGTLASTGSVVPGGEEILELRVFGRDGLVVFDPNAGIATILDAGGREDVPAPEPEQRYPHWAPADNLVGVALGRAPNGSPAEVGLATVALLEALYRSAANGGRAVAI
jgi:predicted dehydrogenase